MAEPKTADERRALAVAIAAGALIPLNSTMIAVALPELAEDLHVGRGTAAVLVTAYLVAMLACQPFGGRAGDRFGTRRVLGVAVTGFSLASLVAASAPTFAVLLVGRSVQALFGAALIPNAQALLRATVAEARRGRMFGLVSTGTGAGAAIGPVLGGVLAEGLGWRAIFAVNVPLGALALVLLARAPRSERVRPASAPEDPDGPGRGGLLRNGAFRAACLTQTTSNYALYTVLLVLPVLLDERGWSGGSVGLATSGLTAGLLVLGPVGGFVGDRAGRRLPVVVGLAVAALGAVLLAAGVRQPALLVAGPLVMGLGMGLSGASLLAAALDAAGGEVAGAAAGLYSASRYVGSIAGTLTISATGAAGAATARPVLAAAAVLSVVAVATGARSTAEPLH